MPTYAEHEPKKCYCYREFRIITNGEAFRIESRCGSCKSVWWTVSVTDQSTAVIPREFPTYKAALDYLHAEFGKSASAYLHREWRPA